MFGLNQYQSFEIILWAMFFAICLASLYTFFLKKVLGDFVKALIESGAVNIYGAKSLEELGYANNKFIKFALRPNEPLRRALSTPDDNDDKFYIPQENLETVEKRFCSHKTTLWTLFLTLFLFLFVVLVLRWLSPYILDYFNNFTFKIG